MYRAELRGIYVVVPIIMVLPFEFSSVSLALCCIITPRAQYSPAHIMLSGRRMGLVGGMRGLRTYILVNWHQCEYCTRTLIARKELKQIKQEGL